MNSDRRLTLQLDAARCLNQAINHYTSKGNCMSGRVSLAEDDQLTQHSQESGNT